jgi:hypothetical protein
MPKKKVGEFTAAGATFRVFSFTDAEGELHQQLVIESPETTVRFHLTGYLHPLGEFLQEAAVRSEEDGGANREEIEEFYGRAKRLERAKWSL